MNVAISSLAHVAVLAGMVGALTACNRQDAPTPGVAGGSATPPAATASAPVVNPAMPDAQAGRGKSPGQDGAPPVGASGQGGTTPAPVPGPEPTASAPPAAPPADAPGTAAPVPPASAPAMK